MAAPDFVMRTSEQAHRELERIVDAVTDSYKLARPIDSLESTALPNSRKIIEAVGDLEHVAYMGFYSARVLDGVNLRHYVSEHLYCAMDILIEQIARAVAYRRHGGGAPGAEESKFAEEVVIDLFRQIPAIRAALALDVQAAFDGDPSANSIEEIIFSYPAIQAITIHRYAHELFKRDVPMVSRIMTEHAHSKTGIDIHPGATLGESFFIDHGTGVVIGETTVIGARVKLYQGVTLGALSVARDECGELIRATKRHPTIEDDVTIYAGATILGGHTVIGKNSIIGSNTWITDSVPPNTRVSFHARAADGNGGTQTYDSAGPRR